MPGPRSHKKPSKKPAIKASQSTMPTTPAMASFLDHVAQAEPSWAVTVNILSDYFDLPDLTTRSGLKKVHADFESIFKRIDTVYKQYHNSHDRLASGIIGIYTKMSTDSILRDKLLDKGLVEMVIPLLSNAGTVQLASLSLSVLTHHGGAPARRAIASHVPTFNSVLVENVHDVRIAASMVSTLSHALSSVLAEETIPDKKLYKVLEPHFSDTIKAVLAAIRQPEADSHCIGHAFSLFAFMAYHANAACKKNPSMINLLIAGLRSSSIATRCVSMSALIRYHQPNAEEAHRAFDPHPLLSKLKNQVPDHLNEAMIRYGFLRCDMVLTLKILNQNQQSYMRCAQDRDLYRLGVNLAEFIWQTEFSITQGMFMERDPKTGKEVPMRDIGLPFVSWFDALPHCAAAIRSRKSPSDTWEDMTDIIDIKHLIITGQPESAAEFSKRSIMRNPHCAYFYYAATLTADHPSGLRAAKKGLKCINDGGKKRTSPFVRFQMLQRAVDHAGDLGIIIMQNSPLSNQKAWEEALALCMSALDDAKTYLQEAPPDNRYRLRVVYFAIILTCILDGPKLNQDLREIQHYLQMLSLADEFYKFMMSSAPPKTDLRQTQQTIVSSYASAYNEWEAVIQRLNALDEDQDILIDSHTSNANQRSVREKAADDLASWLESDSAPHMHGGHWHSVDSDGPMKPEMTHFAAPRVSLNSVELYRCTWCGNPSAALRKCSGCGITRYCDAVCQKAHWTESHKKVCATNAAKAALENSSSASAADTDSKASPPATRASAQAPSSIEIASKDDNSTSTIANPAESVAVNSLDDLD